MTAKQIFDLRKSGDLDGALEAFLGDIPSGYPDVKISQSEDRWLAIAALNVLVDLIRRENNAQTPDPEKLTRYRSLLSGLDLSCDEQNSRRQAAAMQDGQGSSVNRTSFLTPVSAADFQPPETSSPNAGGFDFPQDQTSFSSEGQFQQQSRASSAVECTGAVSIISTGSVSAISAISARSVSVAFTEFVSALSPGSLFRTGTGIRS